MDALCDWRGSDRALRSGIFDNRGCVMAQVRRGCLLARERSTCLRFLAREGKRYLSMSMRSYGLLFSLGALGSMLGRLLLGRGIAAERDTILCLALLASSVFLLPSQHSLSYTLGKSVLVGWLLFSFCRIPRDRLVYGTQAGVDRSGRALLLAALLSASASLFSPTVVLLLLLGILFFLLFSSVPELLLLLILLVIPFLNLLPHTTLPLTALVLTEELFWLGKALCGHRMIRFGALDFFVFLFAFFLLLASLGGGAEALLRGGMMLVLLLSYFPVKSFFTEQVWRRRAVLVIAMHALFSSLLGIGQYFFTDLSLEWVDVSRFSDIGGRVTSFFSNPNVLAVYLLLTFPRLLAEGMKRGCGMRMRMFYFGVVLCELLCLVLTWSRGAWIGALLSLAVFFLLASRRSRRGFLFACIPLLAWLPLLPHSVINRFLSIGMLAESSIRYRIYTWRGTLRMLWAQPLGVGLGEEQIGSVYARYAVSGTETAVHTHNLLLQVAAELGLGGALCLLTVLLLFFQIALGVMRERRAEDVSLSMLGGICAIGGALVMGLFDYIWYHNGIFWLFWVAIGATVGTVQRQMDFWEAEEREE